VGVFREFGGVLWEKENWSESAFSRGFWGVVKGERKVVWKFIFLRCFGGVWTVVGNCIFPWIYTICVPQR